MDTVAKRDRKLQLFMRAIANSSIVERDRLLTYSIGEFYNEMSLFIEEQERKEAEIKKIADGRK